MQTRIHKGIEVWEGMLVALLNLVEEKLFHAENNTSGEPNSRRLDPPQQLYCFDVFLPRMRSQRLSKPRAIRYYEPVVGRFLQDPSTAYLGAF